MSITTILTVTRTHVTMNKDKLTAKQKQLLNFITKNTPQWVPFVSKKQMKEIKHPEDIDLITRYFVRYEEEKLIMLVPSEGRNRETIIHDIRQLDSWFVLYRPAKKEKQ